MTDDLRPANLSVSPHAPQGFLGITHVAVAWPPDEAAARRAHDAFQDAQGVLQPSEYAACFAHHKATWLKVARAVAMPTGPSA